jgi:DNA-binding NtrC family response regulator
MTNKKGRLLIVDDHKNVLKALEQLLSPEFEVVRTLQNPNLIHSAIQREQFDLFLLDMNFSAGVNTGNEGIFWMHEILKQDKEAVIIFITAYGDIDLAVKAVRDGAFGFILKPWDNDKLITTLLSGLALRKSRNEVVKLKSKQSHLKETLDKKFSSFIGNSEGMRKVFNTIDKVAVTDANILILGENGTGKELVAREIHKRSKRANEILVNVDMGSIMESLFETELFGHVKGAFTDAKTDRIGKVEVATDGTIFFDEIGNLPLSMQTKILHLLENKKITRLGSNKEIPLDIRFVCATNKNLKEMVKEGLFRQDLYYRINTIEIQIPPLRERGEDVVLLAEHFLKIYADKYNKSNLRLNEKAIHKLKQYSWPGNIRELLHTIEKAVILSNSNILNPDDFFTSEKSIYSMSIKKPMKFSEIEKTAVQNALENNGGNILKAAEELEIARQTLYNKIQKYGL